MAERRRRRVVITPDDPAERRRNGSGAGRGERGGPEQTPAGRRESGSEAPWSDADPAGERGLRGLVGGGSSQVSPTAALRARDAARPTPEDLARAEAELEIVRRHWVPRD